MQSGSRCNLDIFRRRRLSNSSCYKMVLRMDSPAERIETFGASPIYEKDRAVLDLARFSRSPIHAARRVRVRGNKRALSRASSPPRPLMETRPCVRPTRGCLLLLGFLLLAPRLLLVVILVVGSEIQPGYDPAWDRQRYRYRW